jgi:uroporphyrinogen decarboxylase
MARELGHRERVLRAVEHREVDRAPCYFAAEEEVEERMMRSLGLAHPLDITRYLDADTVQVSIYQEVPDLAAVERPEDLDELVWPSRETVDLERVGRELAEARASGLAVMGGAWATIFTGPRRQMGEAKFLMGMLDQPDLIDRLVKRLADGHLDINEAVFSRWAELIDVCYFGSDLGTQDSLFVSRDQIRRFFLPHIKRLAQHARGYGLKVMYHTCGAVSEIIPDLIECGVDILDPVQASARGMEPARLGELYGGRIAFHGGISTQTVLPQGSPDEVREVVRETIGALGPTGYIVGPDQWLMEDVPLENVEAMYEAAREFRVS